MKQVLLWLLAAAAVALGIAAFIYGGFDDSPGLQGLGALLVLGTLTWLARRRSSAIAFLVLVSSCCSIMRRLHIMLWRSIGTETSKKIP